MSISNRVEISILGLLQRLFSQESDFFLIDVGAHRGEATAALSSHFPQAKAILFEPTPENYAFLQERFRTNRSIQIFNYALSNVVGESQFHTASDSAVNSLLSRNNTLLSTIQVPVQTLDQVMQQIPEVNAVHLIKIDTQGNDLNVLQGAAETIKAFSPVISVEAIFLARYQGQCSYYDIFSWMQSHDYALAGFYNTHYTRAGVIAFSDLLFVPQFIFSQISQPADPLVCVDIEYLVNQNSVLQQACDERLTLIHNLNEIAAERLALIEALDAEVKRLSAASNLKQDLS